jgi:hypothetical protein
VPVNSASRTVRFSTFEVKLKLQETTLSNISGTAGTARRSCYTGRVTEQALASGNLR